MMIDANVKKRLQVVTFPIFSQPIFLLYLYTIVVAANKKRGHRTEGSLTKKAVGTNGQKDRVASFSDVTLTSGTASNTFFKLQNPYTTIYTKYSNLQIYWN